MSVEIADAAAVVGADAVGVPTRITNMWDLEREADMPRAEVYVECPAGYSHGAPDNSYGAAPETLANLFRSLVGFARAHPEIAEELFELLRPFGLTPTPTERNNP